ncbi:MAG: aminoacyl-tRNA hydrolase [Clostridia bacterium]|nr:aminoacyl-tRNA hydrolase [Clostridia bacterium]HAQ63044.1 aminoacyl-tRNA hydrolase [Oscillospiraceae bacterium]
MFDRLQKLRKPVGTPEFLVVGLGNPEKKYTLTRHNSGFLCVDELAEKFGFKINKLKFKAVIADTVINSHRVIVMKPQTYMNNSGEAVKEAAGFYKIPPEKIIIIFDDISLDVGKLRIKRKGTDGGHNGIKSIVGHLGSTNFPRIKLGVGKKPHPDYDLADWVLSEFKKDEAAPLKQAIDNACDALVLMLDGEIDEAMNRFNS